VTPVEITELPASRLAEHAAVRIAFAVSHRLIPARAGDGGVADAFRVEPVRAPYEKDYDQLGESAPSGWPARCAPALSSSPSPQTGKP